MRFKETLITAQNRHDRDRLLCRTLEVVTDDVRVALLERGVSVNTLSAELKAAGITISSGALAKYLSRRSSNSATKRTTTAAKPNHVPQPHGQVKTGTKEPEHRESATGPK
jgi:hypothetical protein